VIYGANLLREGLRQLSIRCLRIVHCGMRSIARVPIGILLTFKDSLFTNSPDGQVVPEPRKTGGRPCGRNRFRGTKDELKKQWPFAA
jgi:hypothetical protein